MKQVKVNNYDFDKIKETWWEFHAVYIHSNYPNQTPNVTITTKDRYENSKFVQKSKQDCKEINEEEANKVISDKYGEEVYAEDWDIVDNRSLETEE